MVSPPESSAEESNGLWQKGQRALTAGLLLAVVFIAFEALAVATILPTVVDEIGGLSIYGWTFSGFMLANLVGITIGGQVADRRGLATPFAVGGVVFAGGLVAGGFAPSMPLLVAARGVQGLGAGALSAVAFAAIGRGYSTRARPKMMAALSSAWVIPGLVGPSLAGWITEVVGWRWVFFALAPATLGGIWIALPGLRKLGRPTEHADQAGDAAGRFRLSLVLVAGTSMLLVGLDNPTELRRGMSMAVGLLLMITSLRNLLPSGTLVARAGLPAATLTLGGIGFVFFGAEAFVPLGLTKLQGLSPTAAGLPLSLGSVFWTVGAWVQAREAPRRSRRAMAATGIFLIAIGIGGTYLSLSPDLPIVFAYASWAVAAGGMGVANSTASLTILEEAPESQAGIASAAMQMAMNLGIALGTGVAGAIVAIGKTADLPLAASLHNINLCMLAVAALTLLACTRVPGKPPD